MMMRYGHFELASFYSGLPSTTPAVQSEVMFGIKTAVPAFSYLDRSACEIKTLYECESAQAVNAQNETRGEPLLRGGHSISNIFAAGSDAARFCTQQLNVDTAKKELNPLRLLAAVSLYLFTAVRVFGLVVIELAVAIFDMITGLLLKEDFRSEIKFVGARVGVCSLLRELARINVKLAIEQGSPIVYVNLLGYDEQSHRRGPSSRFAHWALKGIDRVIRDIYRTARRSNARDYEVVVFSDHGQEHVRSYTMEYGRSVEEAAREAFASGPMADHVVVDLPEQSQAANMCDRMRHLLHIQRQQRGQSRPSFEELADQIVVTAMGPIGHIYLPAKVDFEGLAHYAETLVNEHHVPLVLCVGPDETIHAWDERGQYLLPDQLSEILTDAHVFSEEIAEDLPRLCHHENAGDLIILGWDREQQPLSFAIEGGGHGSIGPEETRGFAIVPEELQSAICRRTNKEDYLRGALLHDAALRFVRGGRQEPKPPRISQSDTGSDTSSLSRSAPEADDAQTVRVMTYNIHSCIGMDGKHRPRRIARAIRSAEADIVCLQEVDRSRARSKHIDQAADIASRLGFYHKFFPILSGDDDQQYGLAIISRFPITKQAFRIFHPPTRKQREARGVMWVQIETPFGLLEVFNTHLGLHRRERDAQIRELLSDALIGGLSDEDSMVLCGDLNAGVGSHVLRSLNKSIPQADGPRRIATFPSSLPIRGLDHILTYGSQIAATSVRAANTPNTRVASDHLPILAEITLIPTSNRPQDVAVPSDTDQATSPVQERKETANAIVD
jgi:endonuclease/exonuclease/phosphatase family metal-dependent hydrolase